MLRIRMGVAIGRNIHISFSPQECVKILSTINEITPPKGKRPAYEEKVSSRLRA
jgi:GTP cyclohydrolase I